MPSNRYTFWQANYSSSTGTCIYGISKEGNGEMVKVVITGKGPVIKRLTDEEVETADKMQAEFIGDTAFETPNHYHSFTDNDFPEVEIMSEQEVTDYDVNRIMEDGPESSTKLSRETLNLLDDLDNEQKSVARTRADEIDINDPLSITDFSNESQRRLQDITSEMLNGVSNREAGPIGDTVTQAVMAVKGLDATDLEDKGFWARLFFRKGKSLAEFMEKYKDIEQQVSGLSYVIDERRDSLKRNVVKFDRLYEALMAQFNELTVNAEAIRVKIEDVKENILKPLVERAEKDNDPVLNQKVQDCQNAIDMLERKYANIIRSRMITLQSIPAIRNVNENNLILIQKLNDIITHTFPAWKNSLAIAVGMHDQQETNAIASSITDMTDQLLIQSSESLREGNMEIKKNIEKGITSVEAIQKANENIIGVLSETAQITQQGRELRRDAYAKLDDCEKNLKDAIINAANAALEDTISEKKRHDGKKAETLELPHKKATRFEDIVGGLQQKVEQEKVPVYNSKSRPLSPKPSID